jgi:hypothetical protein
LRTNKRPGFASLQLAASRPYAWWLNIGDVRLAVDMTALALSETGVADPNALLSESMAA